MFSKIIYYILNQTFAESMDNKRQEVFDELQHIEERMKKNFEPKRNKKDEPEDTENHANTEVSTIKTEETTGDQNVQENKEATTDVEQPQSETTSQPAEDKPLEPEGSTVEENVTTKAEEEVEVKDEPEMPLVQSETSDNVQSVEKEEATEATNTDSQEQ